MIDENLIFVSLITIFAVFIIHKQPFLIATLGLIALFYFLYKGRFTNPKDFLSFITTKIKEAFEPCNSSNMIYCGSDSSDSNLTFLPSIMRNPLIGNDINKLNKLVLKAEDYQIETRFKNGIAHITLDEIIKAVPPLIDYKLYLDRAIRFILSIHTDDIIQKDFLAKKICNKMTKIFYNAYNTISDKRYPINTYNELLYAEREFDDTINIFIFLGINDDDSSKLDALQKEFKILNNKLNEFVIEKVNDIMPNDYDITTSFLPQKDEPRGINIFDNYINL